MANKRQQEGMELGYICGRCGLEQEYLPGEERPICGDCAWPHFEKKPTDIPSEIKLRLNDY